jgi:putative tryptophan/tyrosine transport system substrate-binding protein
MRTESGSTVISRRSFIVMVACAWASPTLVAAQGAVTSYRIGYLRLGTGPLTKSFWDAMRELGWIEGKNIQVEARYATKQTELPELAADLVRLNVQIMLTESIPATRAAMAATKTIPIVFMIGGDPVATGLVASLARPGGNVTGYTLGLYDEKMLEVLKLTVPQARRVAVPTWGVYPDRVARAAQELGLELRGFEVPQPDDIDRFFQNARRTGAGAVFIPNIPSLNPLLEDLGRGATNARLPAIGWATSFAKGGGLLSYGPVAGTQISSRTAAQIDRILKGARPGDLPVEQPTQFTMVVNLRSAQTLGITIPQSVLLRANEVIE